MTWHWSCEFWLLSPQGNLFYIKKLWSEPQKFPQKVVMYCKVIFHGGKLSFCWDNENLNVWNFQMKMHGVRELYKSYHFKYLFLPQMKWLELSVTSILQGGTFVMFLSVKEIWVLALPEPALKAISAFFLGKRRLQRILLSLQQVLSTLLWQYTHFKLE